MPSVSILWGSVPEPGTASIKYDFSTQRELDAFLLGVAEADGWAGHKQVDHGYVLGECIGCSSEADQNELVNDLCIECRDDKIPDMPNIPSNA
jgi:hypothetical protein